MYFSSYFSSLLAAVVDYRSLGLCLATLCYLNVYTTVKESEKRAGDVERFRLSMVRIYLLQN